jgi:hypothetical protein
MRNFQKSYEEFPKHPVSFFQKCKKRHEELPKCKTSHKELPKMHKMFLVYA